MLLFPGFLASDLSTGLLRRYLDGRNYRTHRWRLGTNLGPRPGVLEACQRHVDHLSAYYRRKVSLIGWSLGGVYARETAKSMADKVRCVITLGTPFAGPPRATNAWRLYELVTGERTDGRNWRKLKAPPPVPTTSIYSRTDGIVAWQCSVLEEGVCAENIEVDASHGGLAVHPAVLYAVADRLAQPEGQWRRFERTGFRRFIYRNPRTADWFPSSCLV